MPNAIPTVSAEAPDQEILGALDEFGGVIIEDFLPASVVDDFDRELTELVEAERNIEQQFVSEAIAGFFGDNVTHVSGVAGKSPAFVEHVLCHPRYMSICDHVLLPNCADYQLNIAHVMDREPGCEAQFLHRDEWVWKRLPRMDGDVQLASLIALVDFTADNGATLVVPGSHRWEEGRYPKPEEAVPAEMKAGSAVVYLGSTFHAGGANTTRDSVRRGIHVSYSLGWLRTEENACLATPVDVIRKMPERAQTLLGFGVHDDISVGGGYLGTVELTAPHKLL